MILSTRVLYGDDCVRFMSEMIHDNLSKDR